MADFDFDNEDDVLAAMAKELKEDIDDMSIDSDKGLESFGVAGTVWRVEIGREEYMVVEDDDKARDLAVAIVEQDLEHEPEIFTQSWLENFIDKERLRRDLYADVHSYHMDDLSDEASRDPESFWQQAEGYGMDVPEEDLDDEDWEWPEPSQADIDDLAEKMTDEQLRDPMQYLEDIYGDEATKRAMEIAGIDISAAAEDAVDTDGAGHFLGHYDGELRDGPEGMAYWRTN